MASPHRFEMGQGKILIEQGQDNLGIDARGANYLRLISRMQDIRGDIHADTHLEIQAGNGDYHYDQHLITQADNSTYRGNLLSQTININATHSTLTDCPHLPPQRTH